MGMNALFEMVAVNLRYGSMGPSFGSTALCPDGGHCVDCLLVDSDTG